MSKSSVLYAIFSIIIVGTFFYATSIGYSPFAQGGARPFARTAYGPTHK